MNRIDRKLAKNVIKGDMAACRHLFDTYYPRVFRFLSFHMQHEPDEVEDLAQHVMHDVIRSLPGFKGNSSLLTWIITITRRRFASWVERQARDRQVFVTETRSFELLVSISEITAEAAPGPERIIESKQLVSLAMDLLPPDYAEILELKYLLGHSTADIASHLGTSAKAIESRLSRARESFKTALAGLVPELAGGTQNV